MTPHPLDRISLTFGICTMAAGGIVISHQAGWWKQPNLGVLVAFAIASFAVCVAVMWPRPKATATGAGVDVSSTPAHIAIIMDGNGRWAKERGLPRLAGHRAGVEALRRTVRAVADAGIGWLTIYAFSSENRIHSLH